MCLSRGKMLQNIEFKNEDMCFVIGIPYLLINDNKVNLKKEWLDQRILNAFKKEPSCEHINTIITQFKIKNLNHLVQQLKS